MLNQSLVCCSSAATVGLAAAQWKHGDSYCCRFRLSYLHIHTKDKNTSKNIRGWKEIQSQRVRRNRNPFFFFKKKRKEKSDKRKVKIKMTRVIWNWASCVFIGLLSDSPKHLKCQCQTLRKQQRRRTVFGNFRLQRINVSLLFLQKQQRCSLFSWHEFKYYIDILMLRASWPFDL